MRNEVRHYPELRYSWNNENGVLTNVTYTPYTDDEIRDHLGRNPLEVGELGKIEGIVKSGGESSRLFHCTAHKPWPVGERRSFDWFTADRDVRNLGDGVFAYSRHTC